jgi:N,N'-diacetyllegionaminate synthase
MDRENELKEKVFIIAEAGVNHNGSVEIAKRLIDAAVDTGADAVKFQTFKTEKVVTLAAEKAKYQFMNTGADGSQFEMLKRLELSPEAFKELLSYCEEKDMTFMSTPFDAESVDLLDKLGMNIFKISSGEITNKPLIQHVASKKKVIILSTGMSDLGEVEKAIGWINQIWATDKQSIISMSTHQPVKPLTLLHCVSNYPVRAEDVNLNAIKTMEVAFGLPVGYSDHTMGIEVAIAAVALGARVIEKHLTLDRDMEGPDHKASLEPNELKTMVNAIRTIEKAMGDGIKRAAESEIDTIKIARRSLVAARDIKAGETVLSDDILIKRPGSGIPAEFKDIIVGMQLESDINVDSVIRWEDLKHA